MVYKKIKWLIKVLIKKKVAIAIAIAVICIYCTHFHSVYYVNRMYVMSDF